MASREAQSQDQHAYDSILSSASTCFSPVASRHPPRRRAPESDPSSPVTTATTSERPHTTPCACPFPPPDDTDLLLLQDLVPSVTDDPFFRRYFGARDLPRLFTNPTCPPLRHVTAAQPWPPRRDSLNAPTSRVRHLLQCLGSLPGQNRQLSFSSFFEVACLAVAHMYGTRG